MAGPNTISVSIGEWIRQSADRFSDRACFVEVGGRTSTFAEVNERVNRLVGGLAANGVGRGDRVAIMSLDSAAYLEMILAAMKLGATYVPLNTRLTAAEVAALLARAQPVAVLHDARYRDLVAGVLADPASVRLVIAADGLPLDDGVAFDDLIALGAANEPVALGEDSDILGLSFTSGTTGLPKGVLQSQRMIKHMVSSVLVDYRVREGEVRYAAAPLFHISGMAMALMGVAIGSTSVIAPQFDPAVALDLLAHDQLTACFMVPTMISAVLAQAGAAEHTYDRLELILYGGAPITPTLLSRAMRTFRCDFLNAFGAGTEAGLQTVLTPDDHRRALAGAPHLLGSIGKPATGVTLRLVEPDGSDTLVDVAPGEVGEIATRSDSVMDGYLDMPEATRHAIGSGWFRAGDLAWRDAEGYLYLSGRADDMIIRGGENVHPFEIESVLAEHPAVAESAVVGLPDEHWGEVVVAFVRLQSDSGVAADELFTHCRAQLAAFKVPSRFEFVDVLPTNASGKVLRRVLRDSAPPDGASNPRDRTTVPEEDAT